MKCLNCGCTSDRYLCGNCTTTDVLDRIFYQILFYKPDYCLNPHLAEFVSGLTEKYAERDIIPDILGQFDSKAAEFYYCRYYRVCKDARFEEAAVSYLQNHALTHIHTQRVMYDLIESYLPNDFIKPKRWCEIIAETDDLCCELYASAAKYFAMIGEYDMADSLTETGMELCTDADQSAFLFSSPETMLPRLEKQKVDTNRYRTKKPYWPKTEERRRAIAMFYDEKGIKYDRIESRPKKVTEDEFAPIKECFEDTLTNYCAFWCSEVFSLSAAKCIYQIGAVKVVNGKELDSFESFIRPWDASVNARKSAAKEAGVPLEIIEAAEDVDLVMPKFFAFVGDDVLVSTGALGNQAKLIARAARYAGMTEIRNEFYDLLDLAADTSSDFDLANNTRAYLLSHFAITEGKTALNKAQVNKQLYEALMRCGD